MKGHVGVLAALVTILGFFGVRTVHDLFPRAKEQTQTTETQPAERTSSPLVSVQGELVPGGTPASGKSGIASQGIANLTGSWELRLASSQEIDRDGRVYNQERRSTLLMELNQANYELSGNIFGATSNACTRAKIAGRAAGTQFHLNVLYTGPCCRNGEMIFRGEVDQSSGYPVIRGKLEPLRPPPVTGCWLGWSSVVGTRPLEANN